MTCAKQEQCQHGDGCFVASDYDVKRCTAFKSKAQTNEEWFCQLSTEEKAELLVQISNYDGLCTVCMDECNTQNCKYEDGKNGWIEWLKEIHK